MKIELKKISFNERMSEETSCFVADLYINGKRVGYVKNDGHGGCTDYRGNSKEDNQVIADAEAYCKTLPDISYGTFSIKSNLENVIDTLFEDYLKAKEEKRMLKYMETCILFGVPNAGMYSRQKFSVPLSKIPTPRLQMYVDEIKKEYCKDNVQILNTNLQTLGVQV